MIELDKSASFPVEKISKFAYSAHFKDMERLKNLTSSATRLRNTQSLTDIVKEARLRLLELHYTSQHGHLGGNLSCIDALTVLYRETMGPDDQFILSKGHSAGALYIALWSCGVLSEDDLKTFTKDNTYLSAHPPVGLGLKEVLFGTGSLGHGVPLAAGLALAKRVRKETGRVFCLTGDGEWQEGSCWETLILAVHQKLNTLTILVDANKWQGFGSTEEVASVNTDKLAEQFKAFDAHVVTCNGHNAQELFDTFSAPLHPTKPTIILMNTTKGNNLSFFADTLKCHYLPINEEQYKLGLQEIGASDA